MAKVLAWVRTHKTMLAAAAILLLLDRLSKVWALLYLAAQGPVVLGDCDAFGHRVRNLQLERFV